MCIVEVNVCVSSYTDSSHMLVPRIAALPEYV